MEKIIQIPSSKLKNIYIILLHNSTQQLNYIKGQQQPKDNYDYVRKIKK